MYCPRCASERLIPSQRVEIEIDSCPTCRGIWLDRGELNKIVERLAAAEGRPADAGAHAPAHGADDLISNAPLRRPRGKQSWLRDLLD